MEENTDLIATDTTVDENTEQTEYEELVKYDSKQEIIDKLCIIGHWCLKIFSFVTIIIAILMGYFLTKQSAITELIQGQPASFYCNPLLSMIVDTKSEEFVICYQISQLGTALALLVMGIRICRKEIIGSIIGAYLLISIFVPVMFYPFYALGILLGGYLTLFIILNILVFFVKFTNKIGGYNGPHFFPIRYPGFPWLKKILFNK